MAKVKLRSLLAEDGEARHGALRLKIKDGTVSVTEEEAAMLLSEQPGSWAEADDTKASKAATRAAKEDDKEQREIAETQREELEFDMDAPGAKTGEV